MKRIALLLALMILCSCLCACGENAVETTAEPTHSQEEIAYHESMTSYLTDVAPDQITGNKVVVCIYKTTDFSDGFYSTQSLPAELIADSPEEVRYVIECYEEVRNVGMYTNGAQAYQYFLHANIVDIKYNLIVGGPTVRGGEPPESVSEPGDYYGSRPDFEELTAAITETVLDEIREYEKTLCANCGIRLEDRHVCCPECGTFR